jgi:hypothetical protein
MNEGSRVLPRQLNRWRGNHADSPLDQGGIRASNILQRRKESRGEIGMSRPEKGRVDIESWERLDDDKYLFVSPFQKCLA